MILLWCDVIGLCRKSAAGVIIATHFWTIFHAIFCHKCHITSTSFNYHFASLLGQTKIVGKDRVIPWLYPDGFDCQENCIERVLAQLWIVVHRSTPGINHRRPTSWIARENLVPSKSWDCQGSRYKAKLCHDFDHLLLPRAEFRVYFDRFSWSGSTLSLCTQTIGTAILQYQNFNICKMWGQIISLIKAN